jgi:hypothetical protein
VAVRFPGDTGQQYSDAATLAGATYTALAWVYVVPVLDSHSHTLWNYDQAATDGHQVYIDEQGPSDFVLTLSRAGGSFTAGAVTENTWTKVALTVSAGTGTLYQGAAGQGLTSTADTVSSPSFDGLYIGTFATGGSPLDGRLANFKVYDAVLTPAEIEAEFAQYAPVRLASLRRWYPFLAAGTADYSGNGNTLTGGTGVTTEDGPPIPWADLAAQLTVPAAAGSTTGELAGVTPLPSGALTATSTTAAALAGTTPLPSGALAADVVNAAALAGTTPPPVGALAADVVNAAALAGVTPLPVGTLTAAGETVEGVLAGVTPLPVGALAATVVDSAALAGTTPLPAGALSGSVRAAAALAGATPLPTGALVAAVTVSGVLAGVTPLPVGALSTTPPVVYPIRAGVVVDNRSRYQPGAVTDNLPRYSAGVAT